MPIPIFVSYSRRDAGLVTPVVGLLRATKDLVFQDVDSIMPGKKWRPQIEEALGIAHLIVLFWCYHSSRSAEVRKEYELALSTGKDVLPVLLDATPLPKKLNEYQSVDFRSFVGLRHRSLKRWLAIAAAVSAFMVGLVGFLGVMVFVERDLGMGNRSERLPRVEVPPSPAERSPTLPTKPPVMEPVPRSPFSPSTPKERTAANDVYAVASVIVAGSVLALVSWLMAARSRARKEMAGILFYRVIRAECEKLEQLKTDGLINEEEYNTKRKEILGKL